MTNIADKIQLGSWLHRNQESHFEVLSLRIALRALPGLETTITNKDALILAAFRALFVAWVACRYPTHSMINIAETAEMYLNETQTAAFPIRRVALHTNDSILFAVHAASNLNDGVYTCTRSVTGAIEALYATYEAKDVNTEITSVERAIWHSIESDIEAIESWKALAQQSDRYLASLPIWPTNQPKIFRSFFDKMIATLSDQNGEIWIDWYQSRLVGKPTAFDLPPRLDEKFATELALEGDAFWSRAPSVVNAEIAARLEALRAPSGQDDSVECFQFDIEGRIDRAPLAEGDRLQSTSSHKDLYLEFRKSLRNLTQCSVNELGTTLHNQTNDLEVILTDDIEEVNPHLFWARFDRIRKTLRRHQRATSSNDYSPYRLDEDVADDTLEVVKNGNIFLINQPILLEKEPQSAGPSEDHLDKIAFSQIKDFIQINAEDSAVTTEAVRVDIKIAIEASETLDATPADLKAASDGRKVQQNFVIMLLEKFRKAVGYVGKKGADTATTEGTKFFLRRMWDNKDAIFSFVARRLQGIAEWLIKSFDDFDSSGLG